MATSNPALVLKNFQYRIEAITPTSTDYRATFVMYDPLKIVAKRSSGFERRFFVAWHNSDADIQSNVSHAENGYCRTADHDYTVEVSYPALLPYDDMIALICDDRHDLIKQLREPDKWVGYDSSHATTDIGLWRRLRVSDELETNDNGIWTFRQRWRCYINEVES